MEPSRVREGPRPVVHQIEKPKWINKEVWKWRVKIYIAGMTTLTVILQLTGFKLNLNFW